MHRLGPSWPFPVKKNFAMEIACIFWKEGIEKIDKEKDNYYYDWVYKYVVVCILM
jgi:hypothetical protein